MLVRDGVIEKMFIEPKEPGDPFKVSDADTMLGYINAAASLPKRVTMFTKPGCVHCERAERLLDDAGFKYEQVMLGQGGLSTAMLAAVACQSTTPQVFIEGQHIGGADNLSRYLQVRTSEAA